MRKRKTEKTEKVSVRRRIADGFDASKEILLDVPKIVMLGDCEVVVENYRGIVEYTPTKIVLDANPREVRVLGTGLEMKSVAKEMLYITGKIESVGFVGEW